MTGNPACTQNRIAETVRCSAPSRPVMVADAVKGDLHQRDAAERLHVAQNLLGYKVSVGIQLLNKHAAADNFPKNICKPRMQHGLSAGDGEGVYPAVPRLIKQPAERRKVPLRRQRRIVRGVEAV